MLPWSRSSNQAAGISEGGSASLEFLTAGLILLIPLVYLVVALSAIQGGAMAVEGAARQAARVYVQSPDADEAIARAARAVEFGLADYGIDAADADVRIDCESSRDCLARQNTVTVTVDVLVPLPLVPDVLSLRNLASVPVQASATQTVSRFWSPE
jgi:Flp pilus assembly protein TadG